MDKCCDCIVISHFDVLVDFDDISPTPEVVHVPETNVYVLIKGQPAESF